MCTVYKRVNINDHNKLLAQCKSVVSDILGEIEFCIDIENTYKNTQFKLYTKSQLKLMTILEQK